MPMAEGPVVLPDARSCVQPAGCVASPTPNIQTLGGHQRERRFYPSLRSALKAVPAPRIPLLGAVPGGLQLFPPPGQSRTESSSALALRPWTHGLSLLQVGRGVDSGSITVSPGNGPERARGAGRSEVGQSLAVAQPEPPMRHRCPGWVLVGVGGGIRANVGVQHQATRAVSNLLQARPQRPCGFTRPRRASSATERSPSCSHAIQPLASVLARGGRIHGGCSLTAAA
ncbi:hypothetical protein CB1_000188019 [Camelus ferus]|nr:hypothetical protein CB1_000188019 [Camelus ferus]